MLNELSSIWKRTYLDWESLTETLSYFSAVAKYSYREDDNEILEEFLQKFASHQDNIVIKFIIDDYDSYEFYNKMSTDLFGGRIQEFVTAVEQLEDDVKEENLKIKLEINKKIKNHTNNTLIDHIYSISSWSDYLQGLSIEDLNEQLHKRYHREGIEGIILLGNYSKNCSTDYFHFIRSTELSNDNINTKLNKISTSERLQTRSSLGHFANAADWCFLPENFKFTNKTSPELETVKSVFNTLHNIYLISFLANITIITKGKVNYTLKGLKDITDEYDLVSLRYTDASSLFTLYNWIYSENSVDKIGIARNIIPLHVEQLLSVNESVLVSTYSSFNLSQKKDVKTYIESINKLAEQVQSTSQKANDIAEKISNSIISGIWGVSTFAISTILFRIFTKGSEIKTYTDLFNFIGSPLFVGVMSFALIIFSILFIVTLMESKREQKRFKQMYESSKKIYKNALTEDDIKNILSDDEHFLTNDKYITDKRNFYTRIWFLAMFIAITFLSIASYNSKNISIEKNHDICESPYSELHNKQDCYTNDYGIIKINDNHL